MNVFCVARPAHTTRFIFIIAWRLTAGGRVAATRSQQEERAGAARATRPGREAWLSSLEIR